MSKAPSFATSLFAVVIGALFVVANVAFVTIPYSLTAHPGEIATMTHGQQDRHLS